VDTTESIAAHRQGTRLAAALAHTLPGAVLRLTAGRHGSMLVAGDRADGDLTCCQLRSALIAPRRAGIVHISDVITHAALVAGAIDLGGGLYQPSHPSAADERWFVATVPFDRVGELAAQCPVSMPDEAMSIVLKPDVELACTVVTVTAGVGYGFRLDEVAFWLLSACVADELIRSLDAA
jgi:hypothetical protein